MTSNQSTHDSVASVGHDTAIFWVRWSPLHPIVFVANIHHMRQEPVIIDGIIRTGSRSQLSHSTCSWLLCSQTVTSFSANPIGEVLDPSRLR